ncbi:hypothetical protein BFX12_17530 [Vibrio cholerae]|nr:hypothetical protein BFX12_17530 [Vibrio cholerae]
MHIWKQFGTSIQLVGRYFIVFCFFSKVPQNCPNAPLVFYPLYLRLRCFNLFLLYIFWYYTILAIE